MRFNVTTELDSSGRRTVIRFAFEPHDDDSVTGDSYNAGRKKVELCAYNCKFVYPFEVTLPHPDLCAFAALKISSPFIGSRLSMDRPVSLQMENAITQLYPNIKYVSSSSAQAQVRRASGELIGLSFSGGSDSIAAAYLLPENTKLISLVRQYHPDLGVVEKWNNGNEVADVLHEMPERFDKVPVFTDFAYTSLNPGKKHAVWADRMWHTIPGVLVSEQLGLTGVSMGNIMAAFMENESRYHEPGVTKDHRILLGALNLDSVQPLAGSSEFISEEIVRDNGHKGETLTCNFGPFKNPCMACVKCFRKSLINHVLDGTRPSRDEIEKFNGSKRIQLLSENKVIPLSVTLKYVFESLGMEFDGYVGEIKRKVFSSYEENPSWVRKIYKPFYENSPSMMRYYSVLSRYADEMSEDEIKIMKSLRIK